MYCSITAGWRAVVGKRTGQASSGGEGACMCGAEEV